MLFSNFFLKILRKWNNLSSSCAHFESFIIDKNDSSLTLSKLFLFAGMVSLKLILRVGEISPFEGDIFEGNDVSLICDITPPHSTTIFDLTWHRNGHQIFSSTPKILFTDRTMLLRQIEKMQDGNFSCQMNTKHGRIHSNEIPLNIQGTSSFKAFVRR